VKKQLKSVHIYRSYRQNKPGGPVFLEHPVYTRRMFAIPSDIALGSAFLQLCYVNHLIIYNQGKFHNLYRSEYY